MFCKSRFYFTKNSSVLQTLAQTNVSRLSIVRKPTFKFSQIFNLKSKRSFTNAPLRTNSVNGSLGGAMAPKINVRSDTIISNKSVGYWLIGTSGLVFGIVVLGGLTRLTESGLSITEWKPVTGSVPPLNEADWEEEFNKYKNSPEFKSLNSHITLDEFKFIFSMEWGHRLVGRAIGVLFVLPALYFWRTKKMSNHVKWKVVGLTGLLGLQGVIGWWMVQSGLDEKQLADRRSKPTVSQYRLTTHLGAAFLMYLGVLWTGFEVLNENKWFIQAKKAPQVIQKLFQQLNSPALKNTRNIGMGLLCLTFLTAMSGGMVAGLDAGLIYNTFPHMGEDYLPSSNELMSPVFSRKPDHSDLWWRNLLENPTTVQLIHRILATTTFFSIVATTIHVNKRKAIIPKSALTMMRTVMGFATFQVALGISTLIYLVPIPLAAAHQAGALALLTTCLAFAAQLKRPRPQTFSYVSNVMKENLLKNRL